MAFSESLVSKLPGSHENIFSKMSGMANRYNAINMSQGFPGFQTDDYLKELVYKAMKDGYNQYAPLAGIPELREEIVKKIEALHGKKYHPDSEITLTAGASQAIYCAISAFVHPGDEVIVFKPAYDIYEPIVKTNGGIPVHIQLKGKEYTVDWDEVKAKISDKTRMIVINTPHNPSGTILSKADMLQLESLLKNTNIILLSDEVYEHIIFDGKKHQSASAFPELSKRAIVCASFGKTFHNTGWKMGYCVAPDFLMKEIWKFQEIIVFCVNHPIQRAFAEYLKDPETYLSLPKFYQEKRDYFLEQIKDTKFKIIPSAGTYFQLLDYSEITSESDILFAEKLVKEYQLASIPVSVFNINNQDLKQLRFCFAKENETLDKAAEILLKIG